MGQVGMWSVEVPSTRIFDEAEAEAEGEAEAEVP